MTSALIMHEAGRWSGGLRSSTRDDTHALGSLSVMVRYAERMTAAELAARLRRLPRAAEVLVFEPGCQEYLEREIDEIEWLDDRVYLHLAVCRDDLDNHAPARD